jgi:hypothetical protein
VGLAPYILVDGCQIFGGTICQNTRRHLTHFDSFNIHRSENIKSNYFTSGRLATRNKNLIQYHPVIIVEKTEVGVHKHELYRAERQVEVGHVSVGVRNKTNLLCSTLGLSVCTDFLISEKLRVTHNTVPHECG